MTESNQFQNNLTQERKKTNDKDIDLNEQFFKNDNNQQTSRNKKKEQKNLSELWKNVVIQALSDLKTKSKKWQAKKNFKKAKEWLLGHSEEFFQVCAFAELNPYRIIDQAWNILKNNKKD